MMYNVFTHYMHAGLPSTVHLRMNPQATFYGRRPESAASTPSGELSAIRGDLTALKDMVSQLTAKVEDVCQQQSDLYERLSGVEILGEDLLSKYQEMIGSLDQSTELRASCTSYKERLPRALSVSAIIKLYHQHMHACKVMNAEHCR